MLIYSQSSDQQWFLLATTINTTRLPNGIVLGNYCISCILQVNLSFNIVHVKFTLFTKGTHIMI